MSMPAPIAAVRETGEGARTAVSSLWSLAGPAANSNDPYSRRVARLRLLLPATGLFLLLLVAIWPRVAPLIERLRLAWPAIDVREARELRMLNPRYLGIDRADRPFVVTAAVGRQVPDQRELMSLEAPRADIKTQGGANLSVTAVSGVYQGQLQLLDLFGSVTLVHQNGMSFVTERARVDAAHNAASGQEAVAGHGPQGEIAGEGFQLFDKGDTIVFLGQSHLVANGAAASAAPAAPPAVPRAIARTAAQAEAAAGQPAAAGKVASDRAKPGQIKPGGTKAAQTKPGQTKPGQTKAAQTKPGQTKAAQTNAAQGKSGKTTGPAKPEPKKPA